MSRPRVFTPLHRRLLAILVAIIVAVSLLPIQKSPALTLAPAFDPASGAQGLPTEPVGSELPAARSPQRTSPLSGHTLERRVQTGDTLSEIFHSSKALLTDLQKIMEADAEYLSLETLMPGTELALTYDGEGHFSALTLYQDAARKVIYTKQQDGTFEHQAFEANTHWISEVLRGTVDGSFYASALRSGLTRAQTLLISQLLERQLDFRRDLRAGDAYTIIVGHEMTGEQDTGNTRLEAVSFTRGVKTHYAFQFDDGNYYDENGDSVTAAFLRWPTTQLYRVSSAFNRNRLHPITGRRTPHNGVDLATPQGTPIASTGDGIIRRVGNHPYAGKYVDIDHGGSYTTRYLHLHKILVSKGAQVKRGQKIALSGNTGRSTGAHLHFEFHIKGRPVDPLTADIPTAAAIPQKTAARFKEALKDYLAVMEHAASRSDLLLAEAPSLFD